MEGILRGYLFVVGFASWMSSPSGLRCPSCLYVTTVSETPDVIKAVLSSSLFQKIFNETDCSIYMEKRESEIPIHQCGDMTGKDAVCGKYSGFIDLIIPGLPLSVPIKWHKRGCYFFGPVKAPGFGCHHRNNEEEDLNFVKKTLEIAASQTVGFDFSQAEVENLEGDLCLIEELKDLVTPVSSKNAYRRIQLSTELWFFLIIVCIPILNLY